MTDNTMPTVGATTSAISGMLKKNKVEKTQSGGSFMRFDSKRTGDWLLGAEGEPCTGDVFSLDVGSLRHGQIIWHQKKCQRNFVKLNEDLPEPFEPIHWTDAKNKPQVDESSEARSYRGTLEDGTEFIYEASSLGGRAAVDAVLEQLFMRANAGSPFLFPQITMSSDSYKHSTYGLVYVPVLEVVAWFDETGAEEPEGGFDPDRLGKVLQEEAEKQSAGRAEKPASKKRPKRKKRAAEKPVPEPEPIEEEIPEEEYEQDDVPWDGEEEDADFIEDEPEPEPEPEPVKEDPAPVKRRRVRTRQRA